MLRQALRAVLPAVVTGSFALLSVSCHHVDNRRLTGARANLLFRTQAEWITYGPSGAGDWRVFNREERIPADFPYIASSITGLGGLLVCTTYLGDEIAYDMACPVECRRDITVFINDDRLAECIRCHSTYDVFSLPGSPVSGEAAEKGYGLQIYNVSPGRNGEYRVIY